MISQIKIPAKWVVPSTAESLDYEKHAVAVFNLGFGPCGKTVESMDIYVENGFVIVGQTCTDGETKQFMYRVEDLIGRIEVTYA